MFWLNDLRKQQPAYLAAVAMALICAVLLMLTGRFATLPVLGATPLLPAVLVVAVIGFPAMAYLTGRSIAPALPAPTPGALLRLIGLGAVLALPPIAIDLALPFPKDINLPLPEALLFYPAIALVAEVIFHLIPLALLVLVLPATLPRLWLVLPVILFEPLFQVAFLSGPSLQALLVLGNVGLVSAAQLWLFLRHGFGAMIGLRLVFYGFWHILWGTARLELLF